MSKIGFSGLGIMGRPMVGHLLLQACAANGGIAQALERLADHEIEG